MSDVPPAAAALPAAAAPLAAAAIQPAAAVPPAAHSQLAKSLDAWARTLPINVQIETAKSVLSVLSQHERAEKFITHVMHLMRNDTQDCPNGLLCNQQPGHVDKWRVISLLVIRGFRNLREYGHGRCISSELFNTICEIFAAEITPRPTKCSALLSFEAVIAFFQNLHANMNTGPAKKLKEVMGELGYTFNMQNITREAYNKVAQGYSIVQALVSGVLDNHGRSKLESALCVLMKCLPQETFTDENDVLTNVGMFGSLATLELITCSFKMFNLLALGFLPSKSNHNWVKVVNGTSYLNLTISRTLIIKSDPEPGYTIMKVPTADVRVINGVVLQLAAHKDAQRKVAEADAAAAAADAAKRKEIEAADAAKRKRDQANEAITRVRNGMIVACIPVEAQAPTETEAAAEAAAAEAAKRKEDEAAAAAAAVEAAKRKEDEAAAAAVEAAKRKEDEVAAAAAAAVEAAKRKESEAAAEAAKRKRAAERKKAKRAEAKRKEAESAAESAAEAAKRREDEAAAKRKEDEAAAEAKRSIFSKYLHGLRQRAETRGLTFAEYVEDLIKRTEKSGTRTDDEVKLAACLPLLQRRASSLGLTPGAYIENTLASVSGERSGAAGVVANETAEPATKETAEAVAEEVAPVPFTDFVPDIDLAVRHAAGMAELKKLTDERNRAEEAQRVQTTSRELALSGASFMETSAQRAREVAAMQLAYVEAAAAQRARLDAVLYRARLDAAAHRAREEAAANRARLEAAEALAGMSLPFAQPKRRANSDEGGDSLGKRFRTE